MSRCCFQSPFLPGRTGLHSISPLIRSSNSYVRIPKPALFIHTHIPRNLCKTFFWHIVGKRGIHAFLVWCVQHSKYPWSVADFI